MTAVAKATARTRKNAAKRQRAAHRSEWMLRRASGLQILKAPALTRQTWLVHGFSTRPGGESELATRRDGRKVPEKVLNLGFTDWDTRERVLGNRSKFFRAIGAGKMPAVTLRQIHSDIAHRVDSPNQARPEESFRGDALMTCERGLLLVVQTADCIPILLADTKSRAVAAIHSGWRGTLSCIAQKTLGRMRMEFGTRPDDVIAALGPGIGKCCYEVGPAVAVEFQARFPNAREWFDGPFDALASGEDPNPLPWLTMMPPGHQPPAPRVHLDLIAANRAILTAAGVAPARIFSSGYCTSCRSDLLFSYRREHFTGRQMAAIGIR